MLEILLLKGLPACGKSTYAKKLVEQGSHVRVNKDDTMLSLIYRLFATLSLTLPTLHAFF
jgi:predicted kinase